MAERVLIIDDDARLAAMVSDYLTAAGFVVDCRFTARDGLAAVDRMAFDAIILDVMLPDSDGFEVCRNVRSRSQTPILMLTARAEEAELRFGRLQIDRGSRMVRIDGEERMLTSYQFDLLAALAANAGRVLNRERLMDLVKGEDLEAFDRSIDVHISRIRSVIEDDPKHPRRIITVRGAGYVFAKRQDSDA